MTTKGKNHLPMVPQKRLFGAAYQPGFGGVILIRFGGEINLWWNSREVGRPENRAVYDALCHRAAVKLLAKEGAARPA